MADFLLFAPRFHFALSRTAIFSLAIFAGIALLVTHLTSSLQSSRELHTSILEGMNDALVVTDRRASIVYLNPAAQALAGYTLEEARQKGFGSVFPLRDESSGEDRSELVANILASATPGPAGSHTILTARDGSEYSVEENATPIRSRSGRITGAVVVLRNTTRRRQMLDQLTQAQKMEAIARLAGGIAGDFNNLLTVITGYSELLSSEMAAGNPLRRFAEEILQAAERAAGLTRQLLAFGRGQSIQAHPNDLNTLVTNLETMVKRIVGPSVDLVVLPASSPSRIRTEPGQIEQILVNLAHNARDAMPNGGKLVIEVSHVEVDANTPGRLPDLSPGPYVMLAVSDNGVGMDADTRARLFEPFFTTKNPSQSSGLGLSIVYGIVQQHGGSISAYSQPGAGTIVEIYFPKSKDAATEERIPLPRPRGSETILIADDEDNVRKLVHRVLATNGYTVIDAQNGKEALELYEQNRERIDLVLTDLVMPHLNGYELGERVRALDPHKKIMFMSGYRDTFVGTEYEQDRPLLNKPFTPEILLKFVRDVLDGREGLTKNT
jgi:hypothetical protein